MTVVWSNKARLVFLKYLEQTLENYSVKLANEFIDDTEALITRIQSDKELCPPSKKRNLRKCVVNVNVSMIYKASSSKIEIVTFLFNRSGHKY